MRRWRWRRRWRWKRWWRRRKKGEESEIKRGAKGLGVKG